MVGKKTPAVKGGFKSATTDQGQIDEWFNGTNNNLAIPTGKASGIVVVDEDCYKPGAEKSLEELKAKYGKLPPTYTVKTRAGGFQYYFKKPASSDIRNSAGELATGIDIRGEGGYVVAPPSYVDEDKNGPAGYYEVINETGFAELPVNWIRRLQNTGKKEKKQTQPGVSRTSSIQAALSGFQLPDVIYEGTRSDTLIKYAGHLRGSRVPQEIIEQMMLDVNKARCEIPLDDEEVLSIAKQYEEQAASDDIPADETDWPEPQDVSEVLLPIPPFDHRLLPDMIKRMVDDVAERMCCPVEFPAVAAIVALGSVIGAKVHCRPYKRGTWLVPANVWGVVVAPPSAIKTPPIKEVLTPVSDLDRKAADGYQNAMRIYDIEMKHYNERVKTTAKKDPAQAAAIPVPVKPTQERYIVNDSTYEKLIEIAADNPDGFLMFRDELAGWFHSLNKENQKEARGLYNESWNGTGSYATDRIGRGHVRADNVCISILGTIQPGVFKTIIQDAVSGGTGDDGLTQRFQLMVYPDSKPWKKSEHHPDMEAIENWQNLLNSMATLDPTVLEAKLIGSDKYYLYFDDDAQKIYDLWRDQLEKRIRSDNTDEHPAMLAHLGKYRSLVPKLALILHLAEGGTGPINEKAVGRAIYWTRFLEAHARRIYHTATNRAVACAASLAHKIRHDKLRDGFTRSDVLVKAWSNLRTGEEVGLALTVLTDLGWLVSTTDQSRGGRPAEHFHINPGVNRAA